MRYDTVVRNADSSVTTNTRYGDGVNILTGQAVSEVSADGLIKAQAFDPTARETPANLVAAAAALVNGTALPGSMLLTDIISRDDTIIYTDNRKTEWIQTWFGNVSNLRSQTQTTTSANGLPTTSWIDNDGNSVYERYASTTVAPDGSTTLVYGYYGNTTATNTLLGSNTYTTSANGLVSVLTTSTGLTDTIARLPNANGSYQFSQTVTAGSVAYTTNGERAASSSHSIDANGIDTWTSTSNYGPSPLTTTTVIDVATENRDIAIANELTGTMLGHAMSNEERELFNLYIYNGVYNREQHAYDMASQSLDYQKNFGVRINFNGQIRTVFQGFDIYAAFENALGRLPTAEEIGTFDRFLTVPGANGVAQNFDDIATMAVAIAEYVTNQGGASDRTSADPNAQLLVTAPSWISPASSAVQIQTAGTYSYSGTFITDMNASTLHGVAATINGNNNIVLAGNGSTLTVSGFNNAIDDLYGSATITTSNASIMIEAGCVGSVSGDNNQIAQIGPTQLTLTSGTGDVIFVASAPLPSNPLSYTLAYSTTNASYAVITLGAGVGTAAAPARINGNYDSISATGNDVFTVTGIGNTLAVNGSNDTFTTSNSAISIVDGVTGVMVNGSGNTVSLGAGSSVQFTGTGNSITLGSNYYVGAAQETIITGSSTGSSPSNELDFGSSITDSELWFERVGNNLQIDLMGTENRIDVAGWFSSPGNQLLEITAGGLKLDGQVAQLVQAMASYSSSHAGFDPTISTQVPNDPALHAAIATAWHP